MKKFLALFIGNTVFANVFFLAIVVCGFISGLNIVRENFPEFSLDMITISIIYPGANCREVEEEISIKLEKAIKNVEGIEKYNTFSKENLCLTNIEIKPKYKIEKVIENLRTSINSISDFPSDAEKPVIKELKLKDPVSILYISGKSSLESIKKISLKIKRDIENLDKISKVELFGNKNNEILIEIDENVLVKYNTSLFDLANIINKNSLNLSGGNLKNLNEEIYIRTIGKKYTSEDLLSLTVLSNDVGSFTNLTEISEIKNNFQEKNTEIKINGESGILLTVYKTNEEDALAISNSVKKYIDNNKFSISKKVKIGILYDNTDMLRARINLLLKNGLLGLAFVFIGLWIFVDFKLSFWSGMSIIVSISGALSIIYLMNETINMVSLFGLIMVLGIVVDDAIIIGESVQHRKSEGDIGINAAMNGLSEVGIPVFTAVLTTIIAFIPLFFIGGIMGKFISILPLVVVACLFVSLIESLFLLPTHLISSHKSKIEKIEILYFCLKKIKKTRKLILTKMNYIIFNLYSSFLSKALSWRYFILFMVAVILFIVFGLIKKQFIKFEVFPSIDGFVITSTIEHPYGTPLNVTRNTVEKIEKSLISLSKKIKTKSNEQIIKSYMSIIGETFEDVPRKGSNLGSVQAILIESEKRGIHCDLLMSYWEKEIGIIPGIKSLKFEGLSAGPPGLPIEIWISGENSKILSEVSKNLENHLKKFKGIYQVSSDLSSKKKELCLKLTRKGKLLGFNISDLALQIKAAYYGVDSFEIYRDDDQLKVKVLYPIDKRNEFFDIEKMKVKTNKGVYIPLNSVVKFFLNSNFSEIKRTNGLRRVSITAKVNSEITTANQVLYELSKNYFNKLKNKYPSITISPQGEQKKMIDSLKSLILGFPIAVISIFMVISVTFHSYVQPFIVISTIPLGIVGAIIGHVVLNYNITIMSIFGMVALTGIVVNDAIVLIQQVNKNLRKKYTFFRAVIEGGVRRFMAIFLTTVSTVVGLIPMVLENDLQAKFLIPMAISIAFGTAFASVITLIWIPSCLVILSDLRLVIHKIRFGLWEKREVLEPSYENKNFSDV